MNRQCEKGMDQTIRLNVFDIFSAEERSILSRLSAPPTVLWRLFDTGGTGIDGGTPVSVYEGLALKADAEAGATSVTVADPVLGAPAYQIYEDDIVQIGRMTRRIIKINSSGGITTYYLNRPIECALTTSDDVEKLELVIAIDGADTTDGFLNALLRWDFHNSVTGERIYTHEELVDFVRTPLRCPISTSEFFDSHPGYEDLITRPQSGRFIDAANTLRKAWEKIVQGIKGKGWTPSRILNILDFKDAAYDQAVVLLTKEGFAPPRWTDDLSTYYDLVKAAADDSYTSVMGSIDYDADDDGATSADEQNTSFRWSRVTR